MKEKLRNMFFYVKEQYQAFENDLEKHLDEEVTLPGCLMFWQNTPIKQTVEPIQTRKLKNE
jgi:hypothetical protein